MKCHIIAIGNELLNGEVIDTNSSFLQRDLLHFSFEINKVIILPDDINIIETEIKRSITECDYLFITGGLGPTEDDVTRYALASALNCELIQYMDELECLKAKFKEFGYRLTSNNEKQTFFPVNSMVLNNAIGTASGFYIKEKDCNIFVLPGVPSEMKIMYNNEIIPAIKKDLSRTNVLNKLIVKVIGIGESSLDNIIKDVIATNYPVKWEIIAKSQGVFIKLYPTIDCDFIKWENDLREILNKELSSFIYGYNNDEMNDIIGNLLLDKKLTFSTVESCTGGYVSKYITDKSGSSDYFLGGIVTYSNELKTKLTNVNPKIIEQHGAVSKEVAEAMAYGGKDTLDSDICLSITGIAGPMGGTKEKPVGTVWFCVVDHNNNIITKKHVFNGDRADIRQKSIFYGLNLVRLVLEGSLDFINKMK